MVLEKSGIHLSPDFLEQLQQSILKAFENQLTPLMHTLLPTLEQQGVPRCVASSSRRDRVIRSLQLTNQFRFLP